MRAAHLRADMPPTMPDGWRKRHLPGSFQRAPRGPMVSEPISAGVRMLPLEDPDHAVPEGGGPRLRS